MNGQRTNPPTNLFPFLDILAGTIGSLCLIILAVSLGQTQQALPDFQDTPELSARQAQVAVKAVALREMEASIETAEAVLLEVETDRNRLTQRLQQAQQHWQQWTRVARAASRGQAHRKSIEAAHRKAKELLNQTESLRQRLKTETHRRAGKDRIKIFFTGKGKHLKPRFVECRAGGIVLHSKEGHRSVDWRAVRISEDIKRLFSQVKADAQATVTFLVRPDGIATFNLVEALAQEQSVPSGKLPIPGSGELDLRPWIDPSSKSADQGAAP